MTLVVLMHQLKSHFHSLIWIMMGKYYIQAFYKLFLRI